MNTTVAICVILLLIILTVMIRRDRSSEHFDTYWNHSMGAQKQYERSRNSERHAASKNLTETERLARYTWSERQPNGVQLYDRVYEMTLRDNGSNVASDATYADRDITTDVYDTKFSNLSYGPRSKIDAGDSTLTHYNIIGMAESDPLYTVYNGEYITLSQKTF